MGCPHTLAELQHAGPLPSAVVAREHGMNRETLRVWVCAAKEYDSDAGVGLTKAECDELAPLCKRVPSWRSEKEIQAQRPLAIIAGGLFDSHRS